ncbi:MAG: filamentous hemagglutinin N-terminal domain-containing protein [Leptolyngbya sp. SIO1D8]|nr:filamentous hemagglutinin N-terminal domain-containing protein [Leptolyngbya sp. SIO1D8]
MAQVIFDGSLSDGAVTDTSPDPGGGFTYQVLSGQGLQAGNNNLFYSFEQFNLNFGESIRFENPGVDNIVTRVTGGDQSTIAGTISVAGDPDFYLINPSGIIFNEGAALKISGAFIASTSPGLFFNDGIIEFRALSPESAEDTLLSISSDPGAFNQMGRVGDIQVNDDLLVPSGVRLGFDAYNLTIQGATVDGENGRVFADANSVNISDSFLIIPSGLIEVFADDVSLMNSQIITATTGADAAGGIAIVANKFLASDSALFANSEPGTTGSAGLIFIQGNSLVFDNGTELQAQTAGTGQAGIIALRTDPQGSIIFRNQSTAFSSIEGNGESFESGVPDVFNSNLSGFFLTSDFLDELTTSYEFNLFNIVIDTGTFILSDGSQLQTLVRGRNSEGASAGTAGWIGISADTAIIQSDLSGITLPSGIFSSVGEGATQESSAGAIILDVGDLFLDRGIISTSIESDGTPGLIGVIAARDVLIQNGSFIVSATFEGATANPLAPPNAFPGAVVIGSKRFGVSNNSAVSVTNLGSGVAGDISVFADLIAVNDNSEISADTRIPDDGGNIEIGGNYLILANDSNISTDSGGDGGNISLNIARLIYGTPSEDNNILARGAPDGLGGNIIFPDSVFVRNIAPRDIDFPTSNDITPTGGISSGTISFQSGTKDLNPVQEQVDLPTDLIDPSRLIAQGCAAGNLTAAQDIGELVVTGRGGLPPASSEQLGTVGAVPELIGISEVGGISDPSDAVADVIETPEAEAPAVYESSVLDQAVFVEAQGWMYGDEGEIVLTVAASIAAPVETSGSGSVCR